MVNDETERVRTSPDLCEVYANFKAHSCHSICCNLTITLEGSRFLGRNSGCTVLCIDLRGLGEALTTFYSTFPVAKRMDSMEGPGRVQPSVSKIILSMRWGAGV